VIPMRLLEVIRRPADLAGLSSAGRAAPAREIRALLIDQVSATGGHLGSTLGVVEVTIAVHRVFRSPRDVLLFDTGHQAYVHKILTAGAPSSISCAKPTGCLATRPEQNPSTM
jgi:1-deoxy-D-xylulose-5-phosphate synthase